MGMITGIEEARGRVTIYVDGVAFLKLKKKEFDDLPVEEGEDLDEDDYLNRLCSKQAKPAYESALNLLTARDMTAHDLISALKRRGYLAPVAESVCQRLIENRLIDTIWEAFIPGEPLTEEERRAIKEIDDDVMSWDMKILLRDEINRNYRNLRKLTEHCFVPMDQVEAQFLEKFDRLRSDLNL